MTKLGYTKSEIDGLGNVLGWMGTGETVIVRATRSGSADLQFLSLSRCLTPSP
jgi:hypothetical protein